MKKTFCNYPAVFIFSILQLTGSCKKEELATLPIVSTTPATNITVSTATSGGTISDDGGATITASGICWSTNINPSINDSKTIDGGSIGQFVSNLRDLSGGTTYHIRAYATNSVGIAYGADMSFVTSGQSPVCQTQPAATNISATGATLNGTVNPNYLSTTVTFEYGTTTSYGSNVTAIQSPLSGNTNTNVTAEISGLTAGITYHYRVKATNSLGTTIGDDMTFIFNTVMDVEGNIYKTLLIGDQVWMAENLKTTMYQNGDAIPNVTDHTTWTGLNSGAYCWYNNDAATYKNEYGALYNWYAVSTGRLCPAGWHVPSDSEWTTLTTYMDGTEVAGGKLKETGTTHWYSPNTGATNETCFTALPGGYRINNGAYYDVCTNGSWWSSSEYSATNALHRYMSYNYTNVNSYNSNKLYGLSVRCVLNF